MTLTNYWWLLIWLFTGGLALAAYFPKHREMVCGKIETRWGVVPAVLMVVPYIVWAGYRSDAFGDTAAYRGAFKDASSSFSEMSAYLDTIMKDKGFYGLVAALKSLFHVSDIGCFMLLAGFQLLVIVWLYRKYSSFYWLWSRFFEAGFHGYNLPDGLYTILEDDSAVRRRNLRNRLNTARTLNKAFKRMN